MAAPTRTNFLDLYSDLQQNIALNLDLEGLQSYCKANPLFSGTCRDKNFLERWFKHHYPTFFDDYIRIADAHPELSGFQIVNMVINTVVKIFSFGPDRLSREAGRKADSNLFKYYMATYGWSLTAFENFYLGLIESNKELAPSSAATSAATSGASAATELLNYILTGDNIGEFILDSTKLPTFDKMRTEIRFYMELNYYALASKSLPKGVYSMTPLSQRVQEMVSLTTVSNLTGPNPKLLKSGQSNLEVAIKYLVKCGLILEPHQNRVFGFYVTPEQIYRANLRGLMESGKYEESLHEYIPYSKGVLTEADFYVYVLLAFEEYSIIYYSRDNLNNYLDLIIRNKPNYNYLFQIEDTEILRKLLISGGEGVVTDNLASAMLVSEFPTKVRFTPMYYLSKYLRRIIFSIHLKLVLNNMIFVKLVQIFGDSIRAPLHTILLSRDKTTNNALELTPENVRLTLAALNVVDYKMRNLTV